MYLLDTNILSYARKKYPPVIEWMKSVPQETTFISVITIGEIAKGAALKARKNPESAINLTGWLEELRKKYVGLFLPVTEDICMEWGSISAIRTRSDADALIAATAIVHNLTLVTRNIGDFSDLPVKLINPWEC
jgi:toxin FitB